WSTSLTPADGGLPENLDAIICDSGFLSTMGVQPALGRIFNPEDDRPEAERTVVISRSLWVRRFGANPGILGTLVRLYGEMYKVVGVMPASFDFPTSAIQVWFPVQRLLSPNFKRQRGNHRFSVIGRLKPGVSVEQARTELDGIARRIH